MPSKLAGVRVDRLRFVSLVVSGSLAGASGLVLASTIGSGGSDRRHVVPAAGVRGRVPRARRSSSTGASTPFGTLIAVLLLGTGTTGLALANAPQWSADMFVGSS